MDLKLYAKPVTTKLFSLRRIALTLLSFAMYTVVAIAQPDNAVLFNGINGGTRVSVSANPSLNISSAITIETWIKYTRTSGSQTVLSKANNQTNNSYVFPRTENGWETIQFRLNLNALGWQVLEVPFSGSSHAYYDQWHHLAATFDGVVMRVYIDGVMAGFKTAVGSITVNNNPLWIGGQSGSNEYFRGKIDDVRLWSRALTQCEIGSNKNCRLTGSEADLAMYHKFDQGIADGLNLVQLTALDATANHNDGQMNLVLTTSGLLTSNWTTGIVSGNCTPFTPVEATVGSVEASIVGGSDIRLLSSGGDTYSWTGPNGFTSTAQNPVISSATPLNTGTYTVVVTKNGCSATLSTYVLVTERATALYLDGVNDIVSIPNSSTLNFTNKFSIETWVRPVSHSPLVQNVVCKATQANHSGYIFPRTDDGWQSFSFWLKINNQWRILTAPFTGFNQWTHVAATYDGLFMKIFMNGVEVGSLSAPGVIDYNTNPLSIGQQPASNLTEYYTGGVDEIRLWNRTLSHCEIQNNMNCQLNGANNGLASQLGLAAYYRFNQGLVGANNSTVTTLVDSSGNNNNGTLSNFGLTGTTSNWIAGSAMNLATCTPYAATLPSISSNGPVVEVGQAIQMTASDGQSWSWTGPLGFTSNQQTVFIPNSTTDRSGVYTVSITGNGCTSSVSTKIKVAYKAGTLHFDGVNDQVVVPNSASLNINKTITIESWIRPTNSSRMIQSVVSKSHKDRNTGYIFPRTDDGWQNLSFYLHVNGTWERMIVPYPALNEWHHVSATYDGYYMRVYIDGLLKGTKLIAAGGNITVNANDLTIGQQAGYTAPGIEEYYQGDLEEVRIWNRALSQCELINNMNCEVGQLQNNGLAAYYKFNQGYVDADNTAITTLVDATSNGNNGTLQQFTLDGLTSNWSNLKITGTCVTYAQPPVAASANGSIFAPGSIIRLFGTGGVTYTWDGPNNFASTEHSPIITNVQIPNTGVYTVTAPFVNCVITASVRLVVSNMNPLSVSGPTTFCPSGSVTISTTNLGTAYQWYRDGVAIQNATANAYVARETGNYTVSVTTAAEVMVSEPVSVTVTDNMAPLTVGNLPVLHLQTPATVQIAPTAIDNCSGTITGTTQDPTSFEVPGTYNITWTYNDGNGNTSTQTQTVEVVWSPDVVAPVLSVPGNINRSNDNGICGAVVNFTATATDNRPGDVTIAYSQNPGTVFPVGTTTVVVTATDAAGNTSTGSFTVTVNDTEVPVLTLPANINATSSTGITVGTATATDNCGTPTVSHSTIPGNFPLGTTNITWTTTDAAGHIVSGVQTVTVTDVAAPTLSGVPADAIATCGIIPAAPAVTATDNFDANPTVTMTETRNGNTITRTWTATDASNNSSSATQTITVIPDTQAPVMTAPANVQATSGTGISIGTASAIDNCSVPTVSHSALPAIFPLGVTNITWTAVDAAGNTTTGIQTVTVSDVAAPVLTGVPADAIATCGIIPAAADVRATDNFDANPTVTMTETRNGNTITRTWTATDASGNTSNAATQTITVIPDTQAPVMTAPANVQATSGTGINIGTASAIDNCGTATVSHSVLPAIFPLGVTNVTWTAIDAAGNATTGIQTVTVSDVAAPVLTGVPADATATCGIIPAVADVRATDNFDANPTVTMTETRNGNTITRTWTATDASNNSSSAIQIITVVPDTQAPVLNAPANVTATSSTGITVGTATATDNCGAVTVAHSTIPTTFPLGVTSITWTATDAVGNASTHTQTVTVSDVAAPVLAGIPADATALCGIIPAIVSVTATDNFDANPTVTMIETRNGNTIKRTWTATDASNNSSSATQTITVVPDTQAPILTAPANVNATSSTGIVVGTATATDNCGTATVTNSPIPTTFPLGVTNITWTATDAVGNSATHTQTVTVTDVAAPVLVGVPANVTTECGAAAPAAPSVTATDNFDANPAVTMVETRIGNTITRTWTATDASGNSSNATQVITVVFTAAPLVGNPVNNCGSTILSATGSNLRWSNNETGSSITVNTPGTYTVTQTINGCASAPASVVAAPKAIPSAPAVTVENYCGSTKLSTNAAGILKWSNNTSGSSITVTTNGTYSVTTTVNGCTSDATSTLVIINTAPSVAQIAGNTTVTAGSTTQLTNSTTGGTWSIVNTNVATVNANGLVSGVNAGSTEIRYTVSTPAGCTTVVTATVTVNPNCVAPVVTAANVVANTTSNSTNCTSPVSYTVNVTATPAATVTYTLTGATTGSGNGTGSGVVFNTGVTTVVVRAANSCGANSATFTVTLKDGTAPVPNVNTLPTITGQCSVSLAAAASSNNNVCQDDCRCCRTSCHCRSNNGCQCRDWDYRYRNIVSLILYYLGGYGNWNDDDNHGCGADDNNNSGSQASNAPKATDNCKGTIVGTTTDPLTYTAQGTYTINWKFDDGNGNITIQQQTVIVKDEEKPVISRPSNITVSCGSSTTPSGCNSTATATDNCGTPTVTYTDATIGNVITRTWTATDAAGNSSSTTQTITIVDNTKPTISDVADKTVSCNGSTLPAATGTATATDNCGTPAVTYGDVISGNVITRTWRATDAFGNYSTSTQKITIVADNTNPVITGVADKTVSCNSSTLPSATGSATATDNCSTPVVTYNDAVSGNVIIRTWKATDAAGNYSTSTQKITIGSAFTASVTSKPTSSTYTGGNDNNLYLGYGAQSTKLEVCALPSSGAPYTYSWSGSSTSRLNSTSSSAPTFTPTAVGTYTYAVTVTNKFGCTSTDYITICVTDIRVPGTNGSKVYVCHKTGSKKNPYQTLQVSVNAVSAHLNHGGCGNDDDDDRLGSCDQAPCGTTSTVNTVSTGNQQTVTAESGLAVTNAVTSKAGVATEEELKVVVMPNPSTTYFTLKFESRNDAPLDLRVMDGNGRVVDAKSKIGANSTLQIGHSYTSGTYYAEISQNGKRKVIQLIKARG